MGIRDPEKVLFIFRQKRKRVNQEVPKEGNRLFPASSDQANKEIPEDRASEVERIGEK